MDFAAENFPLYQLLQKLKVPGIEQVTDDFEAAKNGGDEQKYQFAMGLFTVVTTPGIQDALPGLTPALVKTTLEQAFHIFEDTGARGHSGGALMTSFLKATGQGTKEDFDGAVAWLDRAEQLGGSSDFTRELRRKLLPVPASAPKK